MNWNFETSAQLISSRHVFASIFFFSISRIFLSHFFYESKMRHVTQEEKKMLIFIGIAFGKSKNMQDHFHLCCNRALNVLEQSSDCSIKHKQMHNGANDGDGEM